MWKVLINDDGLYSIEVRFDTVDNREWYLCTEAHSEVRAAFDQLMTVPITGPDHSYDRFRWATVVHEIKVSLGIPSPGPLPRLYQQVQWQHSSWRDAGNRENNQFIALNNNGETDRNLLKAIVRDDGHIVVYDATGWLRDVFNYPGATLYEKFLNIPTIFPNVE